MEQTKKMYKKSDIKNAITAYNAKKHYKQTLSLERAQIENTNTWLVTLLPERTNEKGTPLIVSAGKPSKKGMVIQPFRGIGIENFSTCPCKTQPDLSQQKGWFETACPAIRYIHFSEWWTESNRLCNTYKSVKIVLDSASFLMRGKALGYLISNIT